MNGCLYNALHTHFVGAAGGGLLARCTSHLHSAFAVQAPLLGTLAVWWAMSALGFFVAVLPFVTITGFRHGLLRPFVASLALVLLFLPFKARLFALCSVWAGLVGVCCSHAAVVASLALILLFLPFKARLERCCSPLSKQLKPFVCCIALLQHLHTCSSTVLTAAPSALLRRPPQTPCPCRSHCGHLKQASGCGAPWS